MSRRSTNLAIAVVAGAQLMITLDLTIVNVALPSIHTALHFSPSSLAWVVNAYTLVFGGLLLLGGRSGDIFGRRKMFTIGTLLFAGASLFGGLATTSSWLLTGRALQGIGAAIASPTALALISTNFVEPKERGRAFAIYSAVSVAGVALGLLLGGVLTQYVSWRWVFFVNTPIAILLAFAAPRVLQESTKVRTRIDVGGAIIGTAGLASLVYGIINASSHTWTTASTLVPGLVGIALLVIFVLFELRVTAPIINFAILKSRDRAGAIGMILFVMAGMYSIFFFLTQYMQEVMGYSPTKTGLAFLPMTLGIVFFAQVAARSLHRVGPKVFMMLGGLAITIAMFLLSFIGPHSSYLQILLPLLIMSAGSGLSFVSIFPTATHGVNPNEAGMASALVNVGQQVGGTIGLAVLVTIAVSAARRRASSLHSAIIHHQISPAVVGLIAETHGWAMSFRLASVFGFVAFLIATTVVTRFKNPADEATGGEALIL
ncbi:MFS transporter [Ferrimicrobium sp.]|uniref:MFS transporter n=1 Tax=Ferrimicrobium sp. TaxID=2926050 RepID=UPI0026179860|nr:MFS transporter [Ferrimicrobium sp.]